MSPTKLVKEIVPPPSCEQLIGLNYALQADLAELQRECDALQTEYQALGFTCADSVTEEQCLLCEEKEIFGGTAPARSVDLDFSRLVTFPWTINTGYPKDTRFVTEDGELFIDRGNEVYERTCVGFNWEFKTIYPNHEVVCAGGDDKYCNSDDKPSSTSDCAPPTAAPTTAPTPAPITPTPAPQPGQPTPAPSGPGDKSGSGGGATYVVVAAAVVILVGVVGFFVRRRLQNNPEARDAREAELRRGIA